MGMLLWMLGLAWRIICFGIGVVILRAVLSKDVRETVKLAIQTGCVKLKRWLIKEMSKGTVTDEDPDKEGSVE